MPLLLVRPRDQSACTVSLLALFRLPSPPRLRCGWASGVGHCSFGGGAKARAADAGGRGRTRRIRGQTRAAGFRSAAHTGLAWCQRRGAGSRRGSSARKGTSSDLYASCRVFRRCKQVRDHFFFINFNFTSTQTDFPLFLIEDGGDARTRQLASRTGGRRTRTRGVAGEDRAAARTGARGAGGWAQGTRSGGGRGWAASRSRRTRPGENDARRQGRWTETKQAGTRTGGGRGQTTRSGGHKSEPPLPANTKPDAAADAKAQETWTGGGRWQAAEGDGRRTSGGKDGHCPRGAVCAGGG